MICLIAYLRQLQKYEEKGSRCIWLIDHPLWVIVIFRKPNDRFYYQEDIFRIAKQSAKLSHRERLVEQRQRSSRLFVKSVLLKKAGKPYGGNLELCTSLDFLHTKQISLLCVNAK